MTSLNQGSTRTLIVAGIVTAIGLTGLSAAAVGLVSSGSTAGQYSTGTSVCAPPTLAGTVVRVSLTNMGGQMMGGPMMGQHSTSYPRGSMSLTTDVTTVSHGNVSFLATNVGNLTHELVIIPLDSGSSVGARKVGNDGKADEESSLGEASNACGADAGEGLKPGTAGWVTITLAPGKYELLCNLAGHYQAGMYAELVVT
jgi:uncharacterized cupredoxin-like copper-binding protein